MRRVYVIFFVLDVPLPAGLHQIVIIHCTAYLIWMFFVKGFYCIETGVELLEFIRT